MEPAVAYTVLDIFQKRKSQYKLLSEFYKYHPVLLVPTGKCKRDKFTGLLKYRIHDLVFGIYSHTESENQ